MFKASLGLGTKLGAAANKPDLNVRLYQTYIFALYILREMYGCSIFNFSWIIEKMHICYNVIMYTCSCLFFCTNEISTSVKVITLQCCKPKESYF